MAQIIQHRGTVENVGKERVQVRIVQLSACSSCAAKKMCNSSEQKEKLIDVYVKGGESYLTGEEVMLTGTLRMGLKAVVLAYVIPLFLLLAVLFFTVSVLGNEPLGALLSLTALALYYGGLYMNRKALTRNFSFTIKHLN